MELLDSIHVCVRVCLLVYDKHKSGTGLRHPVFHYLPFQGGGSGVVSVSCFGVRVSVMFSLYVCSLYF